MALLDIENLSVTFQCEDGPVQAVKEVSLSVDTGEFIGIVGESGSGKSVTSLALMGLLADNSVVKANKLEFNGQNLLKLNKNERRALLGKDISMIFQEPLTCLNPCFTIGYQLDETLEVHGYGNKSERHDRCIELLDNVGIPDAARQLRAYPHQLSGGMCQRVMIAMAIACNPKLLIADEPTTALDVTIQAQILDLLLDLNSKFNMSIILITHDLAIVSETSENLIVMEKGLIVEKGKTDQILTQPNHPYTQALLQSCIKTHGLENHNDQAGNV